MIGEIMNNKKMKKNIIWIVFTAVFVFLAAGCIWYLNDYYHSKNVSEYLSGTNAVHVEEMENGYFFDGKGKDTAMIFYPGAKVEETAYAALLHRLAEQGVDCFLVKMPCHLAIFGRNRADEIINEYHYERWYMAGHSLGGAMAASYASEHLEELTGLVLLAAYPTKSLAEEEFSVLTLYGTEDRIINREKLKEGKRFMPEDYTEISIEGGNHALFGNYGEQAGDGKAEISRKEQQNQTIQAILDRFF